MSSRRGAGLEQADAIRSLFAFAALRRPEHAEVIQRVLAVPAKRFDKQLITFLTAAEIDALVDALDASRWEGRRDRGLLLLVAQTGLRVSELTGLDCNDVVFGDGASVRCLGKGRKRRAVPLTTTTQAVLRVWLAERDSRGNQPLFRTRTGRRLSTDARLHSVLDYVPPEQYESAYVPAEREGVELWHLAGRWPSCDAATRKRWARCSANSWSSTRPLIPTLTKTRGR